MELYLLLASFILLFIVLLMVLFILRGQNHALKEQLDRTASLLASEITSTRQEMGQSVQQSVSTLGQVMTQSQQNTALVQDKRLEELCNQLTLRNDTLQKTVTSMLGQVDERFKSFSLQSEQRLDNIRSTIENRLTALQDDNRLKLDQIRATVDEKLQKTLEERISQSFTLVSERLEQVYKGLGEMQALAVGVGDLKKVLSNVKTRGILGEIQLGAILEEILSPEQYDTNVATRVGSSNVVEYAIRLPGDGENTVYLPIDSKFPADAYTQLMDAYDSGVQMNIDLASKELDRRIKLAAKEIRDKYIDPPHTTDFAIMFLPFEGLYAEVIRRGLVEILQKDYKINIAGPTTMAALLNSLQMGFRTLAIQKRSSEVWDVLGAVKTEFDKFGDVLLATQQRLEQANSELDKLVGVRTRQIQRKLRTVTNMPDEIAATVLSDVSSDTEE